MQLIDNIVLMCVIAGIIMLIDFFVPLVDLCAGLYKARQRNEKVTSYGLHRTVIKEITYCGSVLIAFGVDIILHMGHLWQLLGITVLYDVPVITVLLGAFNAFVELVSVREKASRKADQRALGQLVSIVKTFSNEEVRQMLEVLGRYRSEEDTKKSDMDE